MGSAESVEVTNPIFGSLKINGQNVILILVVAVFIVVCIMAYVLNAHAGDAKETGAAVARELKEANKEVAAALKDSNKEVAKVLNELAAAMRESNCLAQFVKPEERARNAELCKRISR